MNKRLRRAKLLSAIVFIAVFPSLFHAQQKPEQDAAMKEQQLIQKIKQEVIMELKEGEFLREQIELGIQDYLRKQRQNQTIARAKAMRLANERAKNVRRVSTARDHIYGDPQAPISLIEYSDFECPFCKRFHATGKEIVQAYGGKVNWVYRHFPLHIHNPGAQKQAEASECANELGGNDAFWKYTDAIYARTRSNGRGFPLDKLVPLAKEIGLDSKRFQECLDGGKQSARVREDFSEASRLGITGTPTSILLHNETGDVQIRSGAASLSVFDELIKKLLNE